jgi:hypothetical protein
MVTIPSAPAHNYHICTGTGLPFAAAHANHSSAVSSAVADVLLHTRRCEAVPAQTWSQSRRRGEVCHSQQMWLRSDRTGVADHEGEQKEEGLRVVTAELDREVVQICTS